MHPLGPKLDGHPQNLGHLATRKGLSLNHEREILPIRIQEQRSRGMAINLRADQFRMIDYRAQRRQSFETGISLHDGHERIEYWFPTRIDTVTTEPIEIYLDWLNLHCESVLAEYDHY
jgi:hypothetical protein